MKADIKNKKLILIFILVLIITFGVLFLLRKPIYEGPRSISYLSYSDLVKLSTQSKQSKLLESKLQKQLITPYVVTSIIGSFPGFHPFLRIADWNIERGFKVDEIKRVLRNPSNAEQKLLAKSDIISLNEVDVGMPRTKYKNIAAELASVLGYNYAFATEFVELSPFVYKQKVDPMRYLGLHGNAILSKYPIKSARIIRLPACYDWYGAEISKRSPLEYARRLGAKTVFSEPVISEVRRGGRCALVSDIELANGKTITVVSMHLEDRCYPNCRLRQVQYLLSNLYDVRNPIVLTGDFNTSTTDTAPTSFKKEFTKRIRDPHFIARQLAFAAIPGVPIAGSFVATGVSKLLQYKDPTAVSIPVFFPNQERKLFTYLKDFRFSDGEGFDFGGDRSSNGKGGLLANSNERQFKGFESTFKFEKPRVIAYFKLDWFFVKPKGNKFKPFNARTLQLVNHAYSGRISDHEPIVVDLYL